MRYRSKLHTDANLRTQFWIFLIAFILSYALALTLSGCSVMNPTASDVLKKFCDFHASDIGQVLLSPEQKQAGAVVCGAVGLRLGTPD